MKVVLSTIGRFHTFALARQLHARHALVSVFTGYPRPRLRDEGLPPDLIRSFPWVHAPYMGFPVLRKLGQRFVRELEWLDKLSLDRYAAARLPDCDVFVGLSGSGLRTGQKAQASGARYVCDRGSAHIRVQDALLREEHARWGVPYAGIDPRVIEREECEYAQADAITVPSRFAYRSFIQQGVAPEKLCVLPYGVDLNRFWPSLSPQAGCFEVLYVGGFSLQKGLQYLLQAFARLETPGKRLRIVGTGTPAQIDLFRRMGLLDGEIEFMGHVPNAELRHVMSRSHLLALPSVQDGFGMVMAEAMACACPVLATAHTGAEDLFDDGVEGFIVPPRDAGALAMRMQQLADAPDLQVGMARRALMRVQGLGGWKAYGDKAFRLYSELFQS